VYLGRFPGWVGLLGLGGGKGGLFGGGALAVPGFAGVEVGAYPARLLTGGVVRLRVGWAGGLTGACFQRLEGVTEEGLT
jgi:hypothetical protein